MRGSPRTCRSPWTPCASGGAGSPSAGWLTCPARQAAAVGRAGPGCGGRAGLPAQLSRTLLGFVDRYNQTARPFSWKFTASDLRDLMDRISRHEQQDNPQDKPLPEAA